MESPRSDEETSRPLRVGYPAFPGLFASAAFSRAWRRCGLASTTPHVNASTMSVQERVDYEHWVQEQAK
eukprot:11995489-Alexandrium_andersonii.AAC.1